MNRGTRGQERLERVQDRKSPNAQNNFALHAGLSGQARKRAAGDNEAAESVTACPTDGLAVDLAGGWQRRTQPGPLFCWLCFCHSGQQT